MSFKSSLGDLEKTISGLLGRQFDVDVQQVSFMSDDLDVISIDLRDRSATDPTDTSKVTEKIEGVFEALSLDIPMILLSIERKIPTNLEFLETVRVHSPVTPEQMNVELKKKGYEFLSDNWIKHQLDRYRKRQFVNRRDDDHYVMTIVGLKLLGSQRNRNSSDIKRVLELARKNS